MQEKVADIYLTRLSSAGMHHFTQQREDTLLLTFQICARPMKFPHGQKRDF